MYQKPDNPEHRQGTLPDDEEYRVPITDAPTTRIVTHPAPILHPDKKAYADIKRAEAGEALSLTAPSTAPPAPTNHPHRLPRWETIKILALLIVVNIPSILILKVLIELTSQSGQEARVPVNSLWNGLLIGLTQWLIPTLLVLLFVLIVTTFIWVLGRIFNVETEP